MAESFAGAFGYSVHGSTDEIEFSIGAYLAPSAVSESNSDRLVLQFTGPKSAYWRSCGTGSPAASVRSTFE